jgi:hypothetical protein
MSPAYAQLLAQLMRDRCASRLMVRFTWFIAACAVAEIICRMYFIKPPFGRGLLLMLVCCTGYLWFGAFLKNAGRQNHPAYACLVPGLRRRLMTLTAVLFAGCTLATAMLAGLLVGHAGYGLLCGALFGVYILFAQRYPVLNLLPSMVIVLAVSFFKQPLDTLFAAANNIGEPVVTGVGAILLAWLGIQGVRAAFPHGGDQHWAWHRRMGIQQARLSGALPATGAPGISRWLAWTRHFYFDALRRDSRGGASQGRMMMHALGIPAHDGNGIAMVLVSTLALALIGGYFVGRDNPDVMHMASSAMQGCLLMTSLVYAMAASANAARYGVEQSLYRLTPAAPAAPHINRVLARTLLFRCLRLWLLSFVGAVCIDVVIFGQLRGVTYALAMLSIPFAGLTLRNYAAMRPSTGDMASLAGLLLLVLIYIAALMMEKLLPAFPWFWTGNAIALVSAIGLNMGWRRMMALPPGLPAGRLS